MFFDCWSSSMPRTPAIPSVAYWASASLTLSPGQTNFNQGNRRSHPGKGRAFNGWTVHYPMRADRGWRPGAGVRSLDLYHSGACCLGSCANWCLWGVRVVGGCSRPVNRLLALCVALVNAQTVVPGRSGSGFRRKRSPFRDTTRYPAHPVAGW